MSFIKALIDRGYLYQCTDITTLTALESNQLLTCYIGFDCTANSLHVGNLMQVMILRLFQQQGHKPIVLIGGGTTKVGDPSGKNETRKILTNEDISRNITGIKKSLSKFIRFGTGPTDAILLNNAEWLDRLGYIEFLQEYGREFSVNKMLTRDSVRLRLERQEPLTFLEFNYMLLQAYDFIYLADKYSCPIQIGGSDQWGNIVTGVELIRKKLNKTVFGLTTPLLTTSSGIKMGKSVDGAVWLNEDMLSPYEYFQFWRNTEDNDVFRFANLYAEFLPEELTQFEELAKLNINNAKKQLAHRLTSLCHGSISADQALMTARKVFEEEGISLDLPTLTLSLKDLEQGVLISEVLIKSTLASSKSEAKKLIKGGGVRINQNKVTNENTLMSVEYLTDDKVIKISVGRKRHVLVSII